LIHLILKNYDDGIAAKNGDYKRVDPLYQGRKGDTGCGSGKTLRGSYKGFKAGG